MLPPQKALKIQQRQTLVDRAGDFSNSKGSSVPTASKIGHASFKPTSLAGASRQNGFSSSMSSIRPPSSASSRNTSNGSFASSAGPGSSYAQNNRPQSALQNPKYQKQNTNFHRPSTSLETHAGPQGITRPAKRKGMAQFPLVHEWPSSPIRSVSCGTYETHNSSYDVLRARQPRPKSLRDISLCTGMNQLSLEDQQPQVLKSHIVEPSFPQSSPSRIPKLEPNHMSPIKAPPTGSPIKSPRKPLKASTFYLTRDSNLRAAPFEPEDDFGEFKTQLSEMMNKINGANQESDRAKALVESYKSRGIWLMLVEDGI